MNLVDGVPSLGGLVVLAVAAVVAGAVNSVAGGGTILTFPVLAAILPNDPLRMVSANATSTIGLWPGSLAAAWAYRGERADLPAWSRWLLVPSIAGAIAGTLLLLRLPPRLFDAVVPWLILLAATLFALQPRLAGLAKRDGRSVESAPTPPRIVASCLLQLFVSVYGGYFGAGIGILMLAVLGLLGLGDIHRLNGVKNVLAMVINGVSTAMFVLGSLAGSHQVSWPCVAIMAIGSIGGSLAGSHVARRLPAAVVRRSVAAIGFALAGYYVARRTF